MVKYNKILNQRNKLLKDFAYRPDFMETLSIWDLQLLETGKRIIQRRSVFIKELNEIIQKIHFEISGGKEHLILKYEPSVTEHFFEEKLKDARQKDYKLCQTTIGPHRDDMLFSVNGIDIRKFGSQGQQRTSALSLKLSEIEIVKKSIHNTPVLLLDDVLSELDSTRQNLLLSSISDIQTIITCTGVEEFVKNRFHINKIFRIVNGSIYNSPEHQEEVRA